MQFDMQSSKSKNMQSLMQSNKVSEMQHDNEENEMHFELRYTKPDEIRRAYKAKARGDGSHRPNLGHVLRNSDKEIRDAKCARASTPTDIDLPSTSVPAESNSISQLFFCDKGGNFPPLKNEVLILSSPDKSSSGNSVKIPCADVLVLEQNFQNKDVQVSAKSSQPFIHVIEGTENAAPKPGSLEKKGKKKEKKCEGSAVNRVKRNSARSKDEERTQDHIKRPQHQVLGFMEDHAEFGSDWAEASECRGRYMSSVLESTVDGSIIKGARRVNGSRRMTSAELTSCFESAIETGDVDEDPLKVLDDWGLKSEIHKYKCSCCEKVSHHRSDIERHIESSDTHSEAVIIVLLGTKAQGRNCSICNIRLHRTEYFKHIREVHKAAFPLRCGYCAFQGQDYNQMRHHIKKKHNTSKYEIIDVSHSQTAKDNSGSKLASNELDAISDEEELLEDLSSTQLMTCPLCDKTLKTLRNLKKHVMQHSRQKKQCSLCSFTTNFPTQIRSHYQRKHPTETPKWRKITVAKGGSDALVDDATPYLQMVSAKYGIRKPKEEKWMRQYRCPHCDYTCSFNSSYNRHLRVHKGFKPFKCGYCSFHGREAYVVNKHCAKVHKGKEILVERDENFKSPYRYAKKMKKERFEWDELADVVEKEVHHLGDKLPSDTLKDVKVETQNEAPSEVSFSKPKSIGKSKINPRSTAASIYKCLVISTGNTKNNDGQSERGTLHLTADTEKSSNDSPPVPDMSNFRKTDMTPSISSRETTLPNVQWDEEITSKQNFNLILEDSLPNSIIRQHKKDNSHMEIQEIFPSENEVETVSEQLVAKGPSQQKDELPSYSSSEWHRSSQTIKVNTFKDNSESTVEYPEGNNKCLEKSSHSDMQLSGDTEDPLSTTDFICSCIVIDPNSDKLSDLNNETIVIQLFANENGSFTPKEIVTSSCSEESYCNLGFNQKSCQKSRIDESSTLKEQDSQSAILQLSDTSDSVSLTQNMPKQNNNQEVKCYELVKNINMGDDEKRRKTIKAERSNTPPQGLENNLHSHITFLSDSLAHRISSPISATPGVMTRDLLGLDYSNSDYFSSEKVRLMMKKKKGNRVKCLECGVTTTRRAFYKHAKKHFNIKPFKCGYCKYRSIEKSKIRVHNAFCHSSKPCIILKLSPETAGVDNNANESLSGKSITSNPNILLDMKDCRRSGVSEMYTSLLKNTKDSELEILNKDLRKVNNKTTGSSSTAGLASKSALFQCPLCNKILKNHTPSIRRHLYSHYNYKPYKCGYCSFTAIGQTEIRAHHVTHGSGSAPKIEQSGVPMPFGLTQYIDELLSQQRGNRRVNKKKEQGNQPQLKVNKNPTDIMWHEPDASREDLTAMYLSTEDPLQKGLVTDDQHELDALGVEGCSLQQSLESVEFNAETTYAVQVLESDRQSSSSFPSDLPPQLDLNVGTNSGTDVNADPVCVVYLIE